MAETKIVEAAGHAGLSHKRNKLMGWEMDLAVKEAILTAAANGEQDPELVRSRMLAARQRVKDKYK